MQIFATDSITNLPSRRRAYEHVKTYIDECSKQVYSRTCCTSSTTIETVLNFMSTVICLHGVPDTIVSDRDPRLTVTFGNI